MPGLLLNNSAMSLALYFLKILNNLVKIIIEFVSENLLSVRCVVVKDKLSRWVGIWCIIYVTWMTACPLSLYYVESSIKK